MQGNLGAFFLGNKQIGGFLYWTLDFETEEKIIKYDGDWPVKTIVKKGWQVIASGWWLVETFHPEAIYKIKLYTEYAIYIGVGKITGIKEEILLDRLINKELKIKGVIPMEVKFKEDINV